MFNDLLIFVPKKDAFIAISEGTGDNLLDEDIKEGYQDYVNYCVGHVGDILNGESIDSCDGGMFMYKDLIRNKFDDLEEVIPDLLDDYFGNRNLYYQVLGRSE